MKTFELKAIFENISYAVVTFVGDAPYTLFAPNNDAFSDLLNVKGNDTRILDYDHPLTGKRM